MRKIWLIKTTEPLPCDDNPRLLRMGLLAEIIAKNNDNYITWWASSFDHYRKIDRNTNDSVKKIAENYEIRFIKGITYNSNLSIKRLLHHMHEGRVFKERAEQCDKPDVIVCAMPTLEMAFFATRYARKNKIPILVDLRDMFPDMYADFIQPKYRLLVRFGMIPYKIMLGMALKNATALVATSEKFLAWGARYAKRTPENRDRVYYVSYPDNYVVGDEDDAFWRKFGISNNDFICCFFGKFGYTVDLEMVMEAAKLLYGNSKAKFVICGEGEKLSKYKEILGLCDNVIFPGWVDRSQIAALGKVSSIGLLSYKPGKNYEDSMPNKFCEYLALGQALLVEPEGMMLNLAVKHHCGLGFKNAQELAERVKKLECDRTLLLEMKRNSRILYEEKFCAEIVYAEYAKYVEQYADRRIT